MLQLGTYVLLQAPKELLSLIWTDLLKDTKCLEES